MRHIKTIILFLASFCLFNINVSAQSCSNSEVKDLNSIASYVKASYEVIDKSESKEAKYGESTKTYIIPNYSFEITFYNLTNDIYLNVKDNVTEEEVTIDNKMAKNGNYSFINYDFGRIYKYTIDVMSANPNCYGKKIRTFTLVKPRYNAYSEYTYCQNSSNYYCQKFTEKELNIKDDDDFLKKIKVNNESSTPTTKPASEPINNIIEKNPILYAGVFGGVVIITIIIIVIVKKNKSQKGWKL